jgi:dihydrofolate synthase/folylpolyglutamate synthase
MDHVVSLGPTISDIAWHKAGIIKPGSIAVVGAVPPDAERIIAAEAAAVGAPIINLNAGDGFQCIRAGMVGEFQQTNARLAAGAIQALRQRGFPVTAPALLAGLGMGRLPGRLEQIPFTSTDVWIDGAHNADKMAALAREVSRWPGTEKPVVVLGILGAKDARSMVQELVPTASSIIATQPAVVGKRSFDAGSLARITRECGFTGDILVEPSPESAVLRAERLATPRGSRVLVTGSMYLAGQVRRHWYPDGAAALVPGR